MPQEPRQDLSAPDNSQDDWDEHTPLELEDDRWDAFLPEDDQEPLPELGDFWIEFERRLDCLESGFAVQAA